jgi:hypothetical protein
MNQSTLKNKFATIVAIIIAVIFGYFASQHFGKYMMLAMSTSVFGLGVVIHQTQKYLYPKLSSKTLVVNQLEVKLTRSDKKTKKRYKYSRNRSYSRNYLNLIIPYSKFIKNHENITESTSKSPSFGYCRKRLVLCHRAKMKNSTKTISKN